MSRYRRMTDPGYKNPFISRMPGVPASMEDDREPEYEYKDKLGPNDNPWEWEEQNEYGYWSDRMYEIENSPEYKKAMNDAWNTVFNWMVGILLAILTLDLLFW